MVKCSNCNRPIPEGAKFCGHCGKTTGFVPNAAQQPPFTQYNVMPRDQNGQPVAPEVNAATTRPNCDLSVAGFVMSIFAPWLCVVAFIVSVAALAKKQLRRKLALAGLFISLIEIVAIGVGVYLALFVLPDMGIDVRQYIPWL